MGAEYGAAEEGSLMERPIPKPVGTPVEQLDSPAMVVDLTNLEHNIDVVHSFFLQREAKVRPHVEAHLCPAIARMQLEAGGTPGGVSVTTLGQAEVFAVHGFGDIFLTNEIITASTIQKLCALAKTATMTVAVDSPANVQALSEASQARRVTLRVVVDIHTGLDRCGVDPGRPAVELARAVAKAEGLLFAGLMTCEGTLLTSSQEELVAESRRWIQPVLDTRGMVEKEGLVVEIVSVGGTHNYEVVGAMSGVTEVPAGAYALLDQRYASHRPQLKPAARVMSTVTSRPESGTVIIDAGQKAVGTDTGLPAVDSIAGTSVARMSAEHGILGQSEAVDQLAVGDKVWLVPWDTANCLNVYDQVNAVRNGKLEAVWDVAARGRYR